MLWPPSRCPLSVRWNRPPSAPIRFFLDISSGKQADRTYIVAWFLGGGAAMSILSFILNVLWIMSGGLWMAVAWIAAAVIMAITIIGLPWARAALNIALYTLLPFGQTAVSREEFLGADDVGTGFLGFVGNLIWLVLAGWWLALGHLITALLLAITIIGLPFAWAHLKLAGIALWPIGKMIVPIEEANFHRFGRP